MYCCIVLFLIISVIALTNASTLNVIINYPEEHLNQTYIEYVNRIFNLNIYTCMENHVIDNEMTYGTADCPGAEWTTDVAYTVTSEDRIKTNRK